MLVLCIDKTFIEKVIVVMAVVVVVAVTRILCCLFTAHLNRLCGRLTLLRDITLFLIIDCYKSRIWEIIDQV